MKKTLLIFEHRKGFFISTESLILILLTGIAFLLVYLNSTSNFDFGNFPIYILIIWLFYFIGYMVSNFFLHEHKNGEFKGKIELENDSILINKTKYELNEINKISIHSNDYEGQFVNGTFEFTRHLSNGLNNELTLNLSNGSEINCHFLQTKGQRVKNFREVLINYHLKGKMSWLHLLNVLEIEDYDEIQILKKELKEIK
ncbi:hypothetical protein CSC81_02465 [Tenacibaculum discolor]|uniref:Uncharacterized protein n=1 Tax=Tenacibaculum discolor TaxID=361581 RepID=A0A2G1BWE7_9FLAO|nr:hypothetical protein [Tenacibaculum discolor]MDP2540408.1 hypothetical protein [Tenacibaculum discolor]PHN98371.1 hypothetical protein CSC81_02465 [Tenacibaculum discolor]